MSRINEWWKGKDEWFDKHWSDHITPEFAAWFVSYYGDIDQLDLSLEPDAIAEYFVRMGFAFMGWSAALGNHHLLEEDKQ